MDSVRNIPATIRFNAASDDARISDLYDPTNALGIGKPVVQKHVGDVVQY